MANRRKSKPAVRCKHLWLHLKTEKDRCWWVMCQGCEQTGPAKNTQALALVAWALQTVNQHPRTKAKHRG